MSYWEILSYAAWIISAVLLLWILVDALCVSRQFDESLLMSSREGADELMAELEREEEQS